MTGADRARRFLADPARLFAVLGLAGGLLLLAATPPFQVADEYNHFHRAYQIAEGRLLAVQKEGWIGDDLPVSLTRFTAAYPQDQAAHRQNTAKRATLRAQWHEPLRPGERCFVGFPNTALYPPVAYLPQSLGIALGRVFEAPPVALFYLGRLANVLFWVACTALAIRITPVFPWVFAFVGLAPMSICLAGSLSADAPTNAFAFLFVALTLRAALDESWTVAPCSGRFAALAAAAIGLALAKNAYVGLLPLALLIPPARFGGWRGWCVAMGVLGGVNLALTLAWTRLVGDFLAVPMNPFEVTAASEQARLILAHPLAFAATVGRTFATYGRHFALQMTGTLGWTGQPLPAPVPCLVLAALGAAALLDHERARGLGAWPRLLGAACAGLTAGLVCAAIYLQWNAVGKRIIDGVQGRYFLPLLPIALLFLHNRRLPGVTNRWQTGAVVLCFATYTTARALLAVRAAYY